MRIRSRDRLSRRRRWLAATATALSLVALTGCGNGSTFATDFSVVNAVGMTPMPEGKESALYFYTADVPAAAEAAGLDPGDKETYAALVAGRAEDTVPIGLFLPMMWGVYGESVDTLGWEFSDIDRYAGAVFTERDSAIYVGDGVEIPPSFVEASDGVMTDEGTDSQLIAAGSSFAAERDGVVSIGMSEDVVADWVNHESSIVEIPNMLEVAAALDKQKAISAVILHSPSATAIGVDVPEHTPQAPIDLIGLGMAWVDDEARWIMVYAFDSDKDASESVEDLRAGWEALVDERGPSYAKLNEVHADGNTVTVALTPAKDQGASAFMVMLRGLDPIILSR